MKRNDGKNMQIPIQIPSPSEFVIGDNSKYNSPKIYNQSI